MTEDTVLQLFKDALILVFKIAGPLLIISMLVGIVIAIIQAATQVHEQTLTFVPKLIVIGTILLVFGPFFISSLTDVFYRIMDMIAEIGSHGGAVQ